MISKILMCDESYLLHFLIFFDLFFREMPVFTSAMRITNGRWICEASEQTTTISKPKILQVRTFYFSINIYLMNQLIN